MRILGNIGTAIDATLTDGLLEICLGKETWRASIEDLKPKVIDRRELVAHYARRELGRKDVIAYWSVAFGATSGGVTRLAWCGVFALWALKKAGLTDAVWVIGRGFLRDLKLPTTESPKVGDVAYFRANQHHAIVVGERDVFGERHVELINGNGTGGVVTASISPVSAVTAFYSIEPLVKKATG